MLLQDSGYRVCAGFASMHLCLQETLVPLICFHGLWVYVYNKYYLYVCKCSVYVCAFVRVLLGSCKDTVLKLRSIYGSARPQILGTIFYRRRKRK